MKRLLLFSATLLFIFNPVFSQIGGTSSYNFLKIPVSARSAALAGNMIAANDSDFTLISENPSLLNESMNNSFFLGYINYLADINMGYAGYAYNFKKVGTIAAGLQYLNYGRFTETDVYDQKIGEFTASDYAFNLSFAKKLHPNFLTGGTVKTLYSTLYENKSSAIAADLAGTYISKNNSLIAALVFQNMGSQIKTYSPEIRESLPFEVNFAVSKKIKYAPIRLLASLKNLQKWKLAGPSYLNSQYYLNLKEEYKKPALLLKNLALHSAIGVELIPVKGFAFRLGYDALRRREMELIDRSGMVGFTFGVGIRILKMNLNYARSSYHFAGGSNHMNLSVNIADFTKGRIGESKTE